MDETALPITPVKSRTIGTATETDTAMPVTVVKSVTVPFEAMGPSKPPTSPRLRRTLEVGKEWILKPAVGAAVRDAMGRLLDLLLRLPRAQG